MGPMNLHQSNISFLFLVDDYSEGYENINLAKLIKPRALSQHRLMISFALYYTGCLYKVFTL